MLDDVKALTAIVGTAASAFGAGSIVVAEITAPAAGVLGFLGFTTTSVVTVPVAGVVTVGGLLSYGAYKVHQKLKEKDNDKSLAHF